MAITWNEDTFRRYYVDTVRAPLPQANSVVTYSRLFARNYYRDVVDENGAPPDYPLNEYRYRVERLKAHFEIGMNDRILVLGAGFGFLPETFRQQGHEHAFGMDNSEWIHSHMHSEAHPSMLNPTKVLRRNLLETNEQAQRELADLTGDSTFEWVITESVIESFSEEERDGFLDACEFYLHPETPKGNIIHLAFSGWDGLALGGSPPMALEQWAASRPAHSWAEPAGNWSVRPGV